MPRGARLARIARFALRRSFLPQAEFSGKITFSSRISTARGVSRAFRSFAEFYRGGGSCRARAVPRGRSDGFTASDMLRRIFHDRHNDAC